MLTSRNLVISKFISDQVHTKSLVLNIAVPVSIRTGVKAHSRILTNFDTGGKARILWINAVVRLQALRGDIGGNGEEGEDRP